MLYSGRILEIIKWLSFALVVVREDTQTEINFHNYQRNPPNDNSTPVQLQFHVARKALSSTDTLVGTNKYSNLMSVLR